MGSGPPKIAIEINMTKNFEGGAILAPPLPGTWMVNQPLRKFCGVFYNNYRIYSNFVAKNILNL